MSNRYQEEIDKCIQQLADCDKQICNINRQSKISTILIACNVLVILACLFIASYGLALFLCIISMINYVINKDIQKSIPIYKEHKKVYRKTIASYENLELQSRTLDDVKRRITKAKEPLS